MSKQLYRIVDSGSRGMIAVAARDIKAGELVVEEKEPILLVTQADIERHRFAHPENKVALAAYSVFKNKLSSEQRQKFLTLYGPTTGESADNVRKLVTRNALSPAEVEIMVKVLQIVRLNMFGSQSGEYKVYAELSCFSHSCASNCQYCFQEMAVECHAGHDIKAGEELTLSYFNTRDLEPVHERRHKYLEGKEFTCHCPRCDAPGDDTRQFDCFDPKCKGVMMVCQPINKRKVRGTNLAYTGVEYVEPHLLPCTGCHRAAPADYQAKMFQLEKTLLEAGPRIHQRFSDLMDEQRRSEMEPLYKEILRLQIPSRHGASLLLLRVKWRVLHSLWWDCGPRVVAQLREAVTNYLQALENIVQVHGGNYADELSMVVFHCSKLPPKPVFPPDQEKEMCLKALRLHLLLSGRHWRDKDLDEIMLKCHEKLPSARSTDLCAFCEESPQRAALTLSRCGRCLKVAYCSAGCQKAHWPVHKKTCKATGRK